jgi:DNA helicase-2/ATP-dependent DNA helicase PcrA
MTLGMEILEGLNPAQKQAVETIDGPLLIIAGPGSGKTRVITHRIAYMVRVRDVLPYRIAAVTFTNKAAREMKDRLERLVGPQSDALTVGTFHSFCAQMLRRDGSHVGLSPSYTIFDSDDQLALIKQAMELADIDAKQFPPQAVRSTISKAKSILVDAQAFARNQQNYFEERCARIYHHYEELLARNNAADFDDLLMRAVQLLQDNQEVRERYQERYHYLMVDEFQDTNVAQYRLARLLAEERHNICVVGDPDQSIYSWRSADIRNILSFQNDYADAATISLEQNYRSTGKILEAAKQLISANGIRLNKDLFTDNDQGKPVTIHEAYDEGEEASFVIDEIARLVREEKMERGDCAVMYRVNAQSRALEEACLHRGMKYRLVGGVRFYQRREVKDLMCYLRLLHNPSDEVSLTRVISVPPRGIGAKTMRDMADWAQRENVPLYTAMQYLAALNKSGDTFPVNLTSRAVKSISGFVEMIDRLIDFASKLPVVDLIDRVIEEADLEQYFKKDEGQTEAGRGEERWENIRELRTTAQEFNAEEPPNGLSTLLERLSLVADVDGYEESGESITLITLHQAKGLEFPVVFIVGLEEGLLPHSRSMESEDQMEEERRLCYVGITRAKKLLYMLRAFRRGFMGRSGPTLASRFLRDIPQEITATIRAPGPVATPAPRTISRRIKDSADSWETVSSPKPARLALNVGDLVRHTAFGEGVVTGWEPDASDVQVTVEFRDGVGVKRLLLSFAPLEKIEG